MQILTLLWDQIRTQSPQASNLIQQHNVKRQQQENIKKENHENKKPIIKETSRHKLPIITNTLNVVNASKLYRPSGQYFMRPQRLQPKRQTDEKRWRIRKRGRWKGVARNKNVHSILSWVSFLDAVWIGLTLLLSPFTFLPVPRMLNSPELSRHHYYYHHDHL